jgi:hypothetical protein
MATLKLWVHREKGSNDMVNGNFFRKASICRYKVTEDTASSKPSPHSSHISFTVSWWDGKVSKCLGLVTYFCLFCRGFSFVVFIIML